MCRLCKKNPIHPSLPFITTATFEGGSARPWALTALRRAEANRSDASRFSVTQDKTLNLKFF
jgi:hypothetical protein